MKVAIRDAERTKYIMMINDWNSAPGIVLGATTALPAIEVSAALMADQYLSVSWCDGSSASSRLISSAMPASSSHPFCRDWVQSLLLMGVGEQAETGCRHWETAGDRRRRRKLTATCL